MKANYVITTFSAIGLAGLTAFAFAQDAQDQQRDPQNRDAAIGQSSQQMSTGLAEAQQNLHRRVLEETRRGAKELNVQIEEQELMISLAGNKGLIAGAAASSSSSKLGGSSSPLGGSNREDANADRKQDGEREDASQPAIGSTSKAMGADKECQGMILVTGQLAKGLGQFGSATKPGGAQGSQPGVGQQNPDQKGDQKGGLGNQGSDLSQSKDGESQSFKVRCTAGSDKVELLDASGKVAMTFPLLAIGQSSMGSGLIEAGAPRGQGQGDSKSPNQGDSKSPNQGDSKSPNQGGDKSQKDPNQGGLQNPGSTFNTSSSQDVEWSTIYASVVCGMVHGKK